MKRLYYGLTTILFTLIFHLASSAQTIGIGTDFPTATLDIVSTTAIPGMRVTRSLTPSISPTAAVEINDDSDKGSLHTYYTGPGIFPFSAASYVENNSTTLGQWVTNTNSASIEAVALFTQNGVGDGVLVALNGSPGSPNNGVNVFPSSSFNNAYYVDHNGVNSYGLYNDNLVNGVGVYNDIEGTGYGIVNFHNPAAPIAISNLSDLNNFAGFFAISYYSFAVNASYSVGLQHDNTNGGVQDGDGWSLLGDIKTATPTAGNTVYGAVVSGDQFGPGHGILINHSGTSGRNAEFNISNPSNTDAAIHTIHQGQGSAIVAQLQTNAIISPQAVADISHVGTASVDHVAVFATSAPADNWGIGVDGFGGYRGVVGGSSVGGLTSSGIYSTDDVSAAGVKPFWIDHPLDPENMILKHFSMESNDVLNVYQGTITLLRSGQAVVELPDYFDAINRDFSYQLTAIGTPVQPYIAEEIQNGRFVIKGKPNTKVSWMVLAKRNDAYVQAYPHRILPEIMKKESNRGKYFDPVAHGKPAQMGIFYRENEKHQAMSAYIPEEGAALLKEVTDSHKQRADAMSNRAERNPTDAHRPTDHAIKKISDDDQGLPTEKMPIKQLIKTWDDLH